jgi:hypothetical protein
MLNLRSPAEKALIFRPNTNSPKPEQSPDYLGISRLLRLPDIKDREGFMRSWVLTKCCRLRRPCFSKSGQPQAGSPGRNGLALFFRTQPPSGRQYRTKALALFFQARHPQGGQPRAATVWLCFFGPNHPQAGSAAPKRWLCFFKSAIPQVGRWGGLTNPHG